MEDVPKKRGASAHSTLAIVCYCLIALVLALVVSLLIPYFLTRNSSPTSLSSPRKDAGARIEAFHVDQNTTTPPVQVANYGAAVSLSSVGSPAAPQQPEQPTAQTLTPQSDLPSSTKRFPQGPASRLRDRITTSGSRTFSGSTEEILEIRRLRKFSESNNE